MGKSNQKDIDNEYEIYLNERKLLIKTEYEQATTLDKYILTLSSGTFGLTITFINKIVQSINPSTKWILGLAWGSLILSILSTLISFISSQKACRKQIDIIGENLNNKNSCDYNCFTVITGILNIISITSFIVGITSLFIFVMMNL